MKVWKNTNAVVRAIESRGCIALHSRMVVDNDKIYFFYYDYDNDAEPKYIYALEDYWLDKDYDYHPEREGEYPIVQDAHFNPEYVGFETKGMSITDILAKFEENRKKYKENIT